MIIPISYFNPNNGQNTDIVSRVQSLYSNGEASITVKELEKTYPNTAEAQLQMIQDVTRYIDLFVAPNVPVQPTPTPTPAPIPVAAPQKIVDPNKSPYSLVIAAVLCGLVGNLGVHRFYVGRTGTGLAQLFTFGCLGLWTFADFIIILCGLFRDKEGKKITY